MAHVSVLDNGIHVLSHCMPSFSSVVVGAWFSAGSCSENNETSGLAHCLEHMMFKGTTKRTVDDIALLVESVGGSMNAYTDKEVTAYFMSCLKKDVPSLLEVLADILLDPIFPEAELEQEKNVVCEEIFRMEDTPSDLVFEHAWRSAFPHDLLGRSILGHQEQVLSFTRDHMLDFMHTCYSGKSLYLSFAGDIIHEDLVMMVSQLFRDLKSGNQQSPFKPAIYQGGRQHIERPISQTHMVLGYQGLSIGHRQEAAMKIADVVIGGGMSSRLFREIREKRGLVYTIYTSHDAYKSGGLFSVYCAFSKPNASEILGIIQDYLALPLTEEELEKGKNMTKAALLMGQDRLFSRAEKAAFDWIDFGRYRPVQDLVEAIDSQTTQDVDKMMHEILKSSLTVVTVGATDLLDT